MLHNCTHGRFLCDQHRLRVRGSGLSRTQGKGIPADQGIIMAITVCSQEENWESELGKLLQTTKVKREKSFTVYWIFIQMEGKLCGFALPVLKVLPLFKAFVGKTFAIH